MPDNLNYQNTGWMNDHVFGMMPTLGQPINTNILAGAPAGSNQSALLQKLLGAGLGAATGGGSTVVSGVLNMIPSIFQAIMGGRQLSEAKRIEAENPRPAAEIAPSVNKLVNYSFGQTLNQDVPGGEMYRNEIKGATAAGMRAASELGSGAEAYGALGKLVGSENNQFGDLAKLTAQDVASKQGAYENALGTKASEENRVWDWNKAQPYLRAAQIAAQLRDSGMKNVFNGGANAFGSAAEMAAPDFNSTILNGRGGSSYSGNIPMADLMKILNSLKGNG